MLDTTQERFQQIDAVFDAALDLESEERAAFVEASCSGDADLYAAVMRLLEAHGRTDRFLDGSIAEFAAPLLVPEELPERIGSYRILRELGRGGMGVVYLAERDDPQFQQRVALKVVRTGLLDSPQVVERFVAERQLLLALEHPNIARLFDGGVTSEGMPFFTMVYCEGGSLADRLSRTGALPPAEALRVTRQLVDALAAAHALGIVHRDVKPANVMFDASGKVRLTDFGIAKLVDEDAARSLAIVGTPAYLAPEQVRGEPVDQSTDLWSLGVTIYEMISGRRAFNGPSHANILHNILTTHPPALPHELAIPAGLSALIDRLLQKDPARRPRDAGEVLGAVDALLTPGSPNAQPSRLARNRRHWRVSLVIGGALVAGFAAYGLWVRDSDPALVELQPPVAVNTQPSVAVLPFANTSGDPQDEPFSDGLTDELISVLGRVSGLKVAGRTSAFALKGKGLGVRAVADTLQVANLLEGSVRRVADRLKVTAQLVRAADNAVLWSDTYDRELRDVFAVQEEIARAIATALRIKLAGGAGTPLVANQTADLQAYDLYLKGLYYWNFRNREGLERAVQYFEQAVARDSLFAAAYGGLSDAYSGIGILGYGPPGVNFPKARSAARRALALDSSLAGPHASLAHVLFVHDFDWDAAELEFKRAIALDPSYTYARAVYALLLQSRGRSGDAIAELSVALALDPLSFSIRVISGRVYATAGQPDRAIPLLLEALELNPRADLAYQQLGHVYLMKGMQSEAIAALRRAAALSGVRDSAQLAYAYAVTGQRTEAEALLRDLVGSRDGRYLPPFYIAMAYAGLGNRDQAFRWLEQGVRERASFMGSITRDRAFIALHSDARWARLTARIGSAE